MDQIGCQAGFVVLVRPGDLRTDAGNDWRVRIVVAGFLKGEITEKLLVYIHRASYSRFYFHECLIEFS